MTGRAYLAESERHAGDRGRSRPTHVTLDAVEHCPHYDLIATDPAGAPEPHDLALCRDRMLLGLASVPINTDRPGHRAVDRLTMT